MSKFGSDGDLLGGGGECEGFRIGVRASLGALCGVRLVFIIIIKN